ncbi:unnamed protein product [Rotaria magnacalcarata]|uniref:Mono(ADP-ribosyl)transferase n=2 Tax=Rotaria magnacalcarata TaxID=392030 RepID=A0A819KHY3_9BILA|nr:unnamed protein product [Rotaria magnacalcarata]
MKHQILDNFLFMGNILWISCARKRDELKAKNENNSCTMQKPPSKVSNFYNGCRCGDFNQVQQLLSTMSLDEINKIESNGSTALHTACYHDHYDIVKMLLNAGASRSIRNRRYNLTPFQEAHTEQIRKLFFRANSTNGLTSDADIDRFTGFSVHTEWVMESKQGADWKTNLYKWLRVQQSFQEMIAFLDDRYLVDHVIRECNNERDKSAIQWFFHQAVLQQDVQYFVKAYTSISPFYSIVNTHMAESLLRFFRWDSDTRHPNTLEKSMGYLASIFINHPDLRTFSYTGITYRGMILCQYDLSVYNVGKRLLNKSFLSTSIDRCVAESFAGVDRANFMRRNLNNDLIQYTTLCIYKITNSSTALNIGTISEVPLEQEVLIMPLCAFEIISIKQHSSNESNIHIEIELEECVGSSVNDINESTHSVPQNLHPRIVC